MVSFYVNLSYVELEQELGDTDGIWILKNELKNMYTVIGIESKQLERELGVLEWNWPQPW